MSKVKTQTLSSASENEDVLVKGQEENQKPSDLQPYPQDISNNTEIRNIHDRASKDQFNLEQLYAAYTKISEMKTLTQKKIKDYELKLRPLPRFSEDRLLNMGPHQLSPLQRSMAKTDLEVQKTKMTDIDATLGLLSEKIRVLADKRKVKLKKQRLQIKSQSVIYLRKNLTNIQKRICRLFNLAYTEESVMAELTDLKQYVNDTEEFNRRLLAFIKELDEDAFVLASGRTKYHIRICENLSDVLQGWNSSEKTDFVERLKNTLKIKLSTEYLSNLEDGE